MPLGKDSVQEVSEKSALTSGNYSEARRERCLPPRGSQGGGTSACGGLSGGLPWKEACDGPTVLPRCLGCAEDRLAGPSDVRAGKGGGPGGTGVPRRRRGKCQRQMAPICCTRSGIICLHSSAGLVQHVFQHHLRLNGFLQWLIIEASQSVQGSLTRL